MLELVPHFKIGKINCDNPHGLSETFGVPSCYELSLIITSKYVFPTGENLILVASLLLLTQHKRRFLFQPYVMKGACRLACWLRLLKLVSAELEIVNISQLDLNLQCP